VDLDQARAFAGANHRAVLSTMRADGRPQLSPVTCSAAPDGKVDVSSRETAFKVKNLRRDPRASLCVVSDAWYGGWIQADGTASVVSLPEAMDPLIDYYRSIAGEHPDWDDYRAAMERERRVIVRIELARAGPDRQG
jgi:PPOX class probable F420-dependent enzyme